MSALFLEMLKSTFLKLLFCIIIDLKLFKIIILCNTDLGCRQPFSNTHQGACLASWVAFQVLEASFHP